MCRSRRASRPRFRRLAYHTRWCSAPSSVKKTFCSRSHRPMRRRLGVEFHRQCFQVSLNEECLKTLYRRRRTCRTGAVLRWCSAWAVRQMIAQLEICLLDLGGIERMSLAPCRRRPRSSQNVLQRSVELAAISGRSPASLFLRSDNKRQKATRALHRMAFARLSPRPSRDSVSGRIVCGRKCLSRV
jgi:hypothetical protein